MSAYKLTSIFRFYDKDGSESIDIDEFTELIADALIIRDGKLSYNIPQVVRSVMSKIRTVSAANMMLTEFIAAIQQVPSPFDHPATGSAGLVNTLTCPEFSPTYEDQILPPWEEKKWTSRNFVWGLHVKKSFAEDGKTTIRKCQINNDRLQVKFRIPDLDREIQIRVKRADTVQDLFKKISDEWPGLRGRNFRAPDPSTISLMHKQDGITVPLILRRDRTMENIGLYFLACESDLDISFSLPDLAPPPAPSTSETEAARGHPPIPPSGGELPSLSATSEFIEDPLHTAEDSLGHAFNHRGVSLEKGFRPDEDSPAKKERSPRGALRFDRISEEMIILERRRKDELKKVLSACDTVRRELHSVNDRLLLLADEIPATGEMDPIDRQGLVDMKKDGREHLQQTLAILDSFKIQLSAAR